MALSPNYGWAEPDNSSLVKNGAQDIRALGDAIDTSVWNLGYGQAGKNKIINGDCTINQRGFTSTTTSATYGFDRQLFTTSDGTVTYSAQTFTPGTAPVAGYEAKNFARIVTTGQTLTTALSRYRHSVENVRTFAGQATTFSFWAKAATGTPKIAIELTQSFGSGGSPSTNVNTYIAQVTLSTSWARYSVTVNVPSISGKTIGTTDNTSQLWIELWVSAGSAYDARTGTLGIQSNTFDTWGFQWEYGSKATPFQTATGTIQGELAACQRYYYRNVANGAFTVLSTLGAAETATSCRFTIQHPVTMRIAPTTIDFSTLSVYSPSGGTNSAISTFANVYAGTQVNLVAAGVTGLTANAVYMLYSNNSTSAYFGFSAEL
jgi:ribosomal protein L27